MFTTSCFIRKNTPELRKKLEELGYEKSHYNADNHVFLIANQNRKLRGEYSGLLCDYNPCYCGDGNNILIDCGDNEELFLALAALRNDSDYMQLFTDGKNWFYCDEDKFQALTFTYHNFQD